MKNSFNKLISLIQEKVKLLMKVNELNLIQQELIKKSEFEKLLLSIDENGKTIDEILQTEELVKVTYIEVEDDIKYERSTYDSEICKINELNKKANILLKQTIATNQANETDAIEKMNELKNNIKALNNNKKGLTAYSIMATNVNSYYIDKKE